MNSKELRGVLAFLHQAEKLKTVLRHSWLSSRRRESVAEHSWRMALMAVLLHKNLSQKVDLSKTLKMVLIHDLGEIQASDFPAFKQQPVNKAELERQGLISLVAPLPALLRQEILKLWEEYETAVTPEARFAKFLDKTEVLLQHNEADIKYLTKKEIPLNLYHGKEFAQHDEFLKAFREAINQETLAVYSKNKVAKELYSDWI